MTSRLRVSGNSEQPPIEKTTRANRRSKFHAKSPRLLARISSAPNRFIGNPKRLTLLNNQIVSVIDRGRLDGSAGFAKLGVLNIILER
jgi:hypothetical protein